MISTFFTTIKPMAVMLFCIAVGFVVRKAKIVPDNTDTVLSRLENYVLSPALCIKTFMTYCSVETFVSNAKLMLYAAILLTAAFFLAIPLSKLFEKNDPALRNIYRYSMVFSNFGFMGNAIVPAILGEEALYYYMLFTLPLNMVCQSWGIAVLIPPTENKPVFRVKSLFTPQFIGVLAGIFLGLVGAEKWLPEFMITGIGNLSACYGPLAMVIAGFVIGKYPMKKLLTQPKIYIASAVRLLVLPVLLVGLAALIRADGKTLIMALFAFATPLGLNTVVIPSAYGGNTEPGAAMAMISSVCCVVTIPLLYSLLTALIG